MTHRRIRNIGFLRENLRSTSANQAMKRRLCRPKTGALVVTGDQRKLVTLLTRKLTIKFAGLIKDRVDALALKSIIQHFVTTTGKMTPGALGKLEKRVLAKLRGVPLSAATRAGPRPGTKRAVGKRRLTVTKRAAGSRPQSRSLPSAGLGKKTARPAAAPRGVPTLDLGGAGGTGKKKKIAVPGRAATKRAAVAAASAAATGRGSTGRVSPGSTRRVPPGALPAIEPVEPVVTDRIVGQEWNLIAAMDKAAADEDRRREEGEARAVKMKMRATLQAQINGKKATVRARREVKAQWTEGMDQELVAWQAKEKIKARALRDSAIRVKLARDTQVVDIKRRRREEQERRAAEDQRVLDRIEGHVRRDEDKAKQLKAKSRAAYIESRQACDAQVRRRSEQRERDRLEDIKLQKEWAAELQKREDQRTAKYEAFKANQEARARIYESTGGAEDAARDAHERAVTEKYWAQEQEKRARLAREKEERLAAELAERKKSVDKQLAAKRKAQERARDDDRRFAELYVKESKDYREAEKQKQQEARRQAREYQEVLRRQMQQAQVVRKEQFTDMTPLERSLNNRKLASIKSDPALFERLMCAVKFGDKKKGVVMNETAARIGLG